ncbi:MAG TPA: hypothetical protein VF550_05060 [Polyangia bacterium]
MLKSTLFFALLSLLAPACGKEIGDSCSTNVDCQQDQTRDCDLSQPGGYCTVNGCDEKSCPSEAVCIRIFPYEISRPTCQLDSTLVSSCPAGTGQCLQPDSVCGCTQDSDCTSDGLCVPDVPHSYCVPRTSERRYCLRSCGNDGDCRGGYLCREAGVEVKDWTPVSSSYGSVALVANASTSTVVKFCSPAP